VKLQEISVQDIERAYIGKTSPGRSCRCGCNGEYFNQDGNVLGSKAILKALRTLQANEESVQVNGNIVDLVVKTGRKRDDVITIYLRDGLTVEAENGLQGGQVMKRLSASSIVRDLIDRALLAEPSARAMYCFNPPSNPGVVVRLQPCNGDRRWQVEVRCEDGTYCAGSLLALAVVPKNEMMTVRNLLAEKLAEEFETVRTVTYAG
jgi:hypothetical protein